MCYNVHLSLESQTCECNEGHGWTAPYQTISTSTGLHTASLNTQHTLSVSLDKGRFQKFMPGKIVDFSVKWVDGVLLFH